MTMLGLYDVPLDGVPLTVECQAGEITVVLGRNHAGKTRLCRLIAGLEAPAGGRVVIDGEEVGHLPPGRRSVALVYQAFVNYPNLSVYDNIASPLVAQRRPSAEIRQRVHSIAQRLQIAELLERLPGQLSGGQQQRLAIGRALAKGARVLVLDEPLVNLDYKLREALELELRGMLRDAGLTVVYTTSDPRDAFGLGDRVVLLEAGRLLQTGTPQQVYEGPANLAAADLMSDPGVNRFREAGAHCAVRPEHLDLVPVDGSERRFPLEVFSVETNGSETYLHGAVADHHWVAKLKGLHRIDPGQTVTLHVPDQSILRFAEAAVG